MSGYRPVSSAEIARIMALPSNVMGYLDWSTGLLRVNMESEEYGAVGERADGIAEQFQETLCHEMFHVYQICTTGFLLNYVTAFSKELWLKAFDMESDRPITELIGGEVQLSDELVSLIRSIHAPGAHGLAIIDIVESHAFLAHNRTIEPEIPRDFFRLRMAGLADSPYQKAFGFAERKLSVYAGDYLCPIAYEALCFHDPVEVFVTLVDAVAEQMFAHVESADDIEKIMKHARKSLESRQDHIGNPRRLLDAGQDIHPFYADTLTEIANAYDEEDTRDFMCFPECTPNHFHTITLRPLLLNDSTTVTLRDFEPVVFKTADEHRAGLLLLSALSYEHLRASAPGPSFFALEHCRK